MKTKTLLTLSLLLVLFFSLILAFDVTEWIPANSDFVLQVENLSQLEALIPGEDLAELTEELSWETGITGFLPMNQWKLTLFGKLGLSLSWISLVENLGYGLDLEELLPLAAQPIALVTNIVPYPLLYTAIVQMGREANEYGDFSFSYSSLTIGEQMLTRFHLENIEDYPPVSMDIFLVPLESGWMLTASEEFLNASLSAKSNPAHRLVENISETARARITSAPEKMLTLFNRTFPLSRILLDTIGWNYGRPQWEVWTVSAQTTLGHTSFGMELLCPMAYDLQMEKDLAMQYTYSAEELAAFGAPEASEDPYSSLFLALKKAPVIPEMLPDLLYEIGLNDVDPQMVMAPLMISGLFPQNVRASQVWLHPGEESMLMWMHANDPIGVLSRMAPLVGEEIQSSGDLSWLSSEDEAYFSASQSTGIVEIAVGAFASDPTTQEYQSMQPMSSVYPQWAQRLASFPGKVGFAAMVPGLLELVAGFSDTGELLAQAQLKGDFLADLQAKQQQQEEFDNIVSAYAGFYNLLSDMVWYELEINAENVQQSIDEDYYYFNDPTLLEQMAWEIQQNEDSVDVIVWYTGELPSTFSLGDLESAVFDWIYDWDLVFVQEEDTLKMVITFSDEE